MLSVRDSEPRREYSRLRSRIDEDIARVDGVAVSCIMVWFAWIASPTGITVEHSRNLLR